MDFSKRFLQEKNDSFPAFFNKKIEENLQSHTRGAFVVLQRHLTDSDISYLCSRGWLAVLITPEKTRNMCFMKALTKLGVLMDAWISTLIARGNYFWVAKPSKFHMGILVFKHHNVNSFT